MFAFYEKVCYNDSRTYILIVIILKKEVYLMKQLYDSDLDILIRQVMICTDI